MNQLAATLKNVTPASFKKKIDWAWMLVVALPFGLFALSKDQASEATFFALNSFVEILPFLALAVGAVAYVKASGGETVIGRVFSGNLAVMIILAAAFGALSPFCSCGVIPLIAALLAVGVPLAATMAFWLSSPLMDPSMFLLTASILGAQFAIAKTVAAISVGILGGTGIYLVQRFGLFENPLKTAPGSICGASSLTSGGNVNWQFWQESERREVFKSEAISNFLFLAKWLTLAFILENLMLTYVPAYMIAKLVGGTGIMPIIISAIVAVPAYLNGFAALPLVGGLIEQGMNPAAGMAFLIGGGISCIPAAVAVFALVKKPVFFSYLTIAILGAILSGLGYAAFLKFVA
ncbi:MAG: permease [Rhodospirillales bacterium]|nr:permease [Rhodospirillales bacterium]|tara:strand:- start:427 stop:1476 length:1050 start_codon:yes stop_codon:yes gene_type:complete